MFGMPGGGPNLDVVGAAAAAGLRFVLTRGETAAVIMAATCADLTGTPGAVIVTRGPGLASAVNGIAHAALDRLPVVVIADTVAAADDGRISHQRLDQAALGRCVAKAALTVGSSHAAQAARHLVRLALGPPPGPVIANMDDSDGVSSGSGTAASGPGTVADGLGTVGRDGDSCDLTPLAEAFRAARRPVILLGAGAIGCTDAIRAALLGRGIPALHSYRARGIVPDSAAEAAPDQRGHDGVAAAFRRRPHHRAGGGRGGDDPGSLGLRRYDHPGLRARSRPRGHGRDGRLLHRRDDADGAAAGRDRCAGR